MAEAEASCRHALDLADLTRANAETNGLAFTFSNLMSACAAAGDRRRVEAMLDELSVRERTSHAQPTMMAAGCAAAGRLDDAFAWLERVSGA